MSTYRDNEEVRKLESNLNRFNAYHPESKVPITCESEYHVRAFNRAYVNLRENGYVFDDCINDLVQVLLEVNTHLHRSGESINATMSRAELIIRPEFQAFVDFRKDLGEEQFDFDIE